MKIIRILIALALIALPIAGRYFWFNRGSFQRTEPVQTPDYISFQVPIPPLSTPEPASEVVQAANKIVVVDQYHANFYTMPEMEPLFKAIASRGARIEVQDNTSSTLLPDALKYASAYIVIAPTVNFYPYEITAISSFVERGGKLLVITDPTRNGSYNDFFGLVISSADIIAANLLLAPYEMAFQNDYLYDLKVNEGNFRNIFFKQFAENTLVTGFDAVTFYSAHSITAQPGKATALFTAADTTFTSLTDTGGELTAAMLSENERVLALGDMTFMTTPYNQVTANQAFTERIADFVLTGERTHDLVDFPYLFTRPVSVVLKGKLAKEPTASLYTSLSYLQSSLAYLNTPMSVAGEADDTKDLVVMGLYEDAVRFAPYLKDLNIKPTDLAPTNAFDLFAAPTITLPGIGKVQSAGTGLILFASTPEQNTLILLADTAESLQTLVDKLTGITISGCLIQDQMALCEVGSFFG